MQGKKRKARAGPPRAPHHETVAEEIIKRLKEGTAPWQKPWEAGVVGESPVNATTGRTYRGMNNLFLSMAQPSDDPRWCTYKQAEDQGWQVRKGSHGVPISFYIFEDKRLVRDQSGKPALKNGEKQYEVSQRESPMVGRATVFHASQIDGIPVYEPKIAGKEHEWERHERAERILEAVQSKIIEDQPDRAFYRLSNDEIHIPRREQFPTADAFYATVFHEVGHSTGHESRLNRDMSGGYESENYAREELRAEISSYMLARELGIGHDPGQHASYVASWIKVIESDPREVERAARDAQKIQDFVLELDPEREQEAALESDAIVVSDKRETEVKENTLDNNPVREPQRANLDAALAQASAAAIAEKEAAQAEIDAQELEQAMYRESVPYIETSDESSREIEDALSAGAAQRTASSSMSPSSNLDSRTARVNDSEKAHSDQWHAMAKVAGEAEAKRMQPQHTAGPRELAAREISRDLRSDLSAAVQKQNDVTPGVELVSVSEFGLRSARNTIAGIELSGKSPEQKSETETDKSKSNSQEKTQEKPTVKVAQRSRESEQEA